jgi:hypothetical protein
MNRLSAGPLVFLLARWNVEAVAMDCAVNGSKDPWILDIIRWRMRVGKSILHWLGD